MSDRENGTGLTLDHYAAWIAYPCIFRESPTDAARHLANIITNELVGFTQGTAHWRGVLESFANDDADLSRLERVARQIGAPFTRAEWQQICRETLRLLDAGSGGGETVSDPRRR